MNKELKDKWIVALRSGKYRQGKGFLRTAQNRFCCLGVYCDVVDSTRWAKETAYEASCANGKDIYRKVRTFEGEYSNFPYSLSADLPLGMSATLMRMNDEDGRSFAEIADWIEANVPVTE